MFLTDELASGLDPDRLRIVLFGAGEGKAGQLRVANGHLVFPSTAVLVIEEKRTLAPRHGLSTA